MTIRAKECVVSGLAAFPVVWLALLYLFVIRARVHFGHWPSPADGMAKYMAFTAHHTFTVYALYAAPFVAVGAFAWAIALRREDSGFRVSKPLVVLSTSVIVCTLLVATDPGGFILWFVD